MRDNRFMMLMVFITPILPMLMVGTLLLSAAPQATSNSGAASVKTVSTCEARDTDADGSADIGSNPSEIALQVAKVFADAGYSKAATAGVLGNLQAESGINPTAASGDGGYGLAQWTPRGKIQAWMDANNINGSDSDASIQARMLVATAQTDFNTYYVSAVKAEGIDVPHNNLYELWNTTGDPEVAAVAWMAGWERPNWDLRHEEIRRDTARSYYDHGLDSVTFHPNSNGTSTDGSVRQADCKTDDTNGAQYGEVGGAPTDTDNFGWMCDWGGICHDGDGLQGTGGATRNFYTYNFAGYQCVWYAWNRLAMIHGSDGWSWVSGNGDEIAPNAKGRPGWTVSSSPKPGDGVSFTRINHVAVVEKVEQGRDGWRIFISEGNFGDYSIQGHWTEYHTRWVEASEFGGAEVFFRNNNWK
ncbi:phage tail tip lysozyme [Bifidobacterium felsineum]|uniref:phage tail tip lysozyme n=1 Tax=Bifidobacterium felsineum TaxID=2045440 RepID=UPI001BDC8916|nr:phage tail tip lysozyme [Bifidobacterium felsineum]MBT1164552.1 CHAP domain-containing protein [Bifidobacterium felsineum]